MPPAGSLPTFGSHVDSCGINMRQNTNVAPDPAADMLERDLDEHSGVCMRTAGSKDMHMWPVSALLSMATVTERHPDILTKANVSGGKGSADKEQHWMPDPDTGVNCPPQPGQVIPVNEMPTDHPAITYLINRGFNMDRLYKQFKTSYCTEEFPHGDNEIYYRKMPGGWRDTPQHRIIFYSIHDGTRKTWQGRYVDYVTPDKLGMYALNPYTEAWDHVATRSNAKAAWIYVGPFNEVNDKGGMRWSPSKYKTATHSFRELMGWDAAVENAKTATPFSWCILVEGPLDAARVGPGGIALIGKSINAGNAAKVAKAFNVVFTAFDNDSAGYSLKRVRAI